MSYFNIKEFDTFPCLSRQGKQDWLKLDGVCTSLLYPRVFHWDNLPQASKLPHASRDTDTVSLHYLLMRKLRCPLLKSKAHVTNWDLILDLYLRPKNDFTLLAAYKSYSASTFFFYTFSPQLFSMVSLGNTGWSNTRQHTKSVSLHFNILTQYACLRIVFKIT